MRIAALLLFSVAAAAADRPTIALSIESSHPQSPLHQLFTQQKEPLSADLLFRARNVDKECMVATRVVLASTSHDRRTGLLQHDAFPAGSGLWIAPCEAIHTFGMKFPIDILFLDSKTRVVKIYPYTKVNRVCFCLRAVSVLELPAGTIENTGTSVNDLFDLESARRT